MKRRMGVPMTRPEGLDETEHMSFTTTDVNGKLVNESQNFVKGN